MPFFFGFDLGAPSRRSSSPAAGRGRRRRASAFFLASLFRAGFSSFFSAVSCRRRLALRRRAAGRRGKSTFGLARRSERPCGRPFEPDALDLLERGSGLLRLRRLRARAAAGSGEPAASLRRGRLRRGRRRGTRRTAAGARRVAGAGTDARDGSAERLRCRRSPRSRRRLVGRRFRERPRGVARLGRAPDDQDAVLDRGRVGVDDLAEDGADRGPQAVDAVGADREVAQEHVDGLGAVAVGGEQLHRGDVVRPERDLAEVAGPIRSGVEDLEPDVSPSRAELEAEPLARPPGTSGAAAWRPSRPAGPAAAALASASCRGHLARHCPGCSPPCRWTDRRPRRPARSGARSSGRAGRCLWDAIARPMAAPSSWAGLGSLRTTRFAVIVKSPPILSVGRLPAGLLLAGGERDAQAVVLPLERLLLAVALGVERGLVERLGVEAPAQYSPPPEQADQQQDQAVSSAITPVPSRHGPGRVRASRAAPRRPSAPLGPCRRRAVFSSARRR